VIDSVLGRVRALAMLSLLCGLTAVAQESGLAAPETFQLGQEIRRRELEEVRALELFPLAQSRPAERPLVMSRAEIEGTLRNPALLADVPEEFRGAIASLPVLSDRSPFEIGEWVPMPDGTLTYLLALHLEGADRIRVRLGLRRDLPNAFAVAYGGTAAEEIAGPVPLIGSSVLLPSVGSSLIHVEIRNLPMEAERFRDAPLFEIQDILYYSAEFFESLNPAPAVGAVCSYQDVNCASNVSSVKAGVVKLDITAGSGSGWCTGALLRDNESTTDIPYILTAGHCVPGGAESAEIYFWDESASCNSSSNHGWRQIVTPAIFQLGAQDISGCQSDADWALLRFNLLSAVSHVPTFLSGKTQEQPFGRKIYEVHHPGGERKKYSQGDLSLDLFTYVRPFDFDTGNTAEPGSSGSPLFDSTDLTIIGVINCVGLTACSSSENATMTKYSHIASQISRFLNPALATPAIVSVTAPSSSPLSSSFLVTIVARNNGSHTSTDGHIHIAIPSYTSSSDAGLVALETKSSDLTYGEYPAGFNGLGRRNGSADSSAAYLHIESRDSSWSASEENTITIRVTPKAAGTMQIWYRAAMRSQNDYYYGTPSDSSYDALDTDQQWPLRSISVTITQTCFALTRTHSGQGSDPGAIPANSSGCSSGQYVAGEYIVLAASPSSGWTVSGWSGTNDNSSTATTNSVTMPASSRTVSVAYSQIPPTCYSLTRTHTGQGSNPTAIPTSSSGCSSGQYIPGEYIVLTASPSSGWTVSGWSGTNDNSNTGTTNSVTMPASSRTVSVAYSQIPPTCYPLTRTHTGQGSNPTAIPTSSSGCSSGQYIAGEYIVLTASPSSGWTVSGWSGTNDNSSTATMNSVTMPAASRTVSVAYSQVPASCYVLTRTHTGQGADPTANPASSSGCNSGQYVAGENISLSSSPSSGWSVTGWSGTNNDSSTSTTNSVTMPAANRTISVTYSSVQSPPPTVVHVTPSSGPVSGATPVVISGTNFAAGATVTFGGIAATNVSVNNSTTITCTTPAHAAGFVNVAVTNPDAQSGLLGNAFNYTSATVAVYDESRFAPRCISVGSVCDSGTLLDGRGAIGPESHASNTIGQSCPDGNSGAYHGDESIDRVLVSTVDGSSFSPGDAVRIDTTVWAYSDYASDHLDLFYAADASNPAWTYITTIEPFTPGAQQLSAVYTLPAGGATQAVRAVFRFAGSTGACNSNSGYDDYDDLLFAVDGNSATHTLTILSSNPSSGVGVSVSPADTNGSGNGTTSFTRIYDTGAVVTLTAPSSASGGNFQKWQRDGADWTTNTAMNVTMDADHVVTAVYGQPQAGIPMNVAATFESSVKVVWVSWSAIAGAYDYEVEVTDSRGFTGIFSVREVAGYAATTTGFGWNDLTICARFRVRSVDSAQGRSGWSNADIATTMTFTDDPVSPGSTQIKAFHVQELRTAAGLARTVANLPAYPYTNSLTPSESLVRAVDLGELRTALSQALGALGVLTPTWTDPSLTAGTLIKAAHLQQLRNATK
jgi:hypothetical protein